ncbi:hypothetical protein RirG_095140 [Rhizophagus irregularis DAOM 197198w]|uniref:Protein kinase domain-containing protein n=1 Tax=Rhizophagus irregularis (strain DAOM 197198w) TaxID=1432141 RepID=A0A015MS23_RHIIW|nr:hypothetical protein RirG_095140 [Rhizophagus irregularis DAOM 197198w]
MDSFGLIKLSDASEICKKCNCICYSIQFQHNFKNWTSGNDNIDKIIQNTQLSVHEDVSKVLEVLEWIPYDKLYNITKDDEFGKVYRANWIDEYISYDENDKSWDNENQNWIRNEYNMFVNLKSLNTPNIFTLEFVNKIKFERIFYGITQDPETKNYMMVLNNICERCNKICNSIHFQRKFIDWTSGNNDIDKFIKNTQLSAHEDVSEVLEWIPHDRFHDIKYHIAKDEFCEVYRANWIDGHISYCKNSGSWDNENQNWIREGCNMFVNLKSLNTSNILTLEFVNEIKFEHEFYGITQDPETKNYMMVLSNKCKMCNKICNTTHFQYKFIDWTSGNDDIDKFIQDSQLSVHNDNEISHALEWMPYDRFHDIKYIAKDEFCEVYRANWIDGHISYCKNSGSWDNENQNWIREGCNMFVNLKSLNTSNILTLEFVNEIKFEHEFYGITQDPETKNYMMVLSNKCKMCNKICNTIHFQYKFIDWTSGNDDIDKFIQDSQLSVHNDNEISHALEWMPHDRFHDIKYIAKDEFCEVYRANWIDGHISDCKNSGSWDNENQNWIREGCNMFVNLKSLNTSNILTLEFVNEIKIEHEFYGITWDPETKNYMMVLNNKCKECNKICNSIYFQQNFENWTSGNDDIDKFIQNTQLSVHKVAREALEWIPYDRFHDIKYIAEDDFGKVYRANWIDGYISYDENDKSWDNVNQNWRRNNLNMFVNLKSLNTPNDLTFELANKIKIEHTFYGITQDPETKNYMMIVLNNKCKECNKIYCNSIYFQRNFENWTSGNDDIDKFIQDTQLSAHKDVKEALEWIPYNRFYDIKYIAKGGFGKVYRAYLTNGFITDWDSKNQKWKRNSNDILVALKSLNNSKNITPEFINEVLSD